MATPIRWYKFSEDTADLGKDSSTNRKDLTNFGVTSVADATYGKVAYFNGSSYLKLGLGDIPTSMTAGNSRTMAFWMKPEGTPGGLITYGNKVSNWSTAKRYAVNYAGDSGPIEILLFNMTATKTGSSVISTNEWNHVTVVFNDYGNLSQIYINGNLSVSTVRNLNTAANYDLYVGWYQENGSHFVGRMADMRFYDNAMNSASILSLYNDGPTIPMPATIQLQWKTSTKLSCLIEGNPTSSYQVEIGGQKTDIKAGETFVADGLASDTKYTVNLY